MSKPIFVQRGIEVFDKYANDSFCYQLPQRITFRETLSLDCSSVCSDDAKEKPVKKITYFFPRSEGVLKCSKSPVGFCPRLAIGQAIDFELVWHNA